MRTVTVYKVRYVFMCLKENVNGCKHEMLAYPSTTLQSFLVTFVSYDDIFS